MSYELLTDELFQLANELKPWYVAIVPNLFVVYVYEYKTRKDLEPPYGKHLFDIYAEHIKWHDISHLIPNDAVLIIRKIQSKLQEIDKEVFDL